MGCPVAQGPATGVTKTVRAVRTSSVTCFEPPQCARCGDALEPVTNGVVGQDGLWSCLQARGALLLRLDGGYGMAIDPIGTPEHELTVVVCGPCLPGFGAANPWLVPLLKASGAQV